MVSLSLLHNTNYVKLYQFLLRQTTANATPTITASDPDTEPAIVAVGEEGSGVTEAIAVMLENRLQNTMV